MTRFQTPLAIPVCAFAFVGLAARGVADEPAAAKHLDLAFIPPQAVAAIVAHPRAVLTGPDSEWLPNEVITAAGMKEAGIDPVKVDEAVAIFASPTRGTEPNAAAILRFAEPYSKPAVTAKLVGHEKQIGGKSVVELGGPQDAVLFLADEKTIVIGAGPLVEKMLTVGNDADSPLIKLLKRVDVSSHATAVFSIDAVRPMMKQAMTAAPPVPPQFQDFLKLPDLVSAIVLRVNAGETFTARITLRAMDEAAGQETERIVNQGLVLARQAILMQITAQQLASTDSVEQAGMRYGSRIVNKIFDQIKPTRGGQNVTLSVESNSSIAAVGVLAGLMLPAVQSARSAAERVQSANNLKQIGLALLNFESANRHFPAHAIVDKNGKPLLSWRVAILPFIEQNNLFNQFHLDEPWDSEHNKPLLDQMPGVFQDPRRPRGNTTNYLAIVGKGLAFEPDNRALKIQEFTDGTSNTLLVVQVNDDKAVPWTKPDDLEVDMKKPLEGLGEAEPNGFSALFADGHVMLLSKNINSETLRRLFGRADGQVVDPSELNP
jgi:prepilin-type processing-associated H-X9-DG protein